MVRYIHTESIHDFEICTSKRLTTCKLKLSTTSVDNPEYASVIPPNKITKLIEPFLNKCQVLEQHFHTPSVETLARYFALRYWRIATQSFPYVLTVKAQVTIDSMSAEVELNVEELMIGGTDNDD